MHFEHYSVAGASRTAFSETVTLKRHLPEAMTMRGNKANTGPFGNPEEGLRTQNKRARGMVRVIKSSWRI